jgi:hypothetical protein
MHHQQLMLLAEQVEPEVVENHLSVPDDISYESTALSYLPVGKQVLCAYEGVVADQVQCPDYRGKYCVQLHTVLQSVPWWLCELVASPAAEWWRSAALGKHRFSAAFETSCQTECNFHYASIHNDTSSSYIGHLCLFFSLSRIEGCYGTTQCDLP